MLIERCRTTVMGCQNQRQPSLFAFSLTLLEGEGFVSLSVVRHN